MTIPLLLREGYYASSYMLNYLASQCNTYTVSRACEVERKLPPPDPDRKWELKVLLID